MTNLSQIDSFYEISQFTSAYDVKPQIIPFTDFVLLVKNEALKFKIDLIRKESDHQKRNILKSSLPSICPSALFAGSRRLLDVSKSTGLICLDIDNIDNIIDVKRKISLNKFTHCVFVSPSNNGLKVFVKHDSLIHNFIETFNALERYYKLHFNITIDKACKDITRLCYYSSDENLFYYSNSDIFTDKLAIKPPHKPAYKPPISFNNRNITEIIVNKIKSARLDITSVYSDWIRIAYALCSEFGINGLNYFIEISQFHPRFTPAECVKVYNSALRSASNNVTIKSLYSISSYYGIYYKS